MAIFTAAIAYFPGLAAASAYDDGLVYYSQGKYAEALREFYLAAEQQESGAAHMIMLMQIKGQGSDTGQAEVFRWSLVAAAEGMAEAQYSAGKRYLHRSTGTHSQQAALYWFKKAVKQGHILAHYELATMYQNGVAVPVNKTKAFTLYQYAASELNVFAQKGDAKSQTQLAVMYEHGHGMPVNVGLAMKWMQKAANQGDAEAQFNMGRMLANSVQFKANPEEALYWVNRAVQLGHKNAQQLRDRLETRWPEFARR